MIVKGTSKKHIESNLKQHKKSNMHKELMKSEKAQQDAHMSKSEGSRPKDEGVEND